MDDHDSAIDAAVNADVETYSNRMVDLVDGMSDWELRLAVHSLIGWTAVGGKAERRAVAYALLTETDANAE